MDELIPFSSKKGTFKITDKLKYSLLKGNIIDEYISGKICIRKRDGSFET